MGAVVADARRFADMHAVYRMYDERGHLLYVGVTGDLGQRLGEHSVKRWFPLVETVRLEWFPHRAAAAIAEKRAIIAEHPRYNKAGMKPPKLPPRPEPSRPVVISTPRDLLADLDRIIDSDRVRLSGLPHLLRQLAPGHEPYQKLTGTKLRAILKEHGVRTTNSDNVPRLASPDLRHALQSGVRIPN